LRPKGEVGAGPRPAISTSAPIATLAPTDIPPFLGSFTAKLAASFSLICSKVSRGAPRLGVEQLLAQGPKLLPGGAPGVCHSGDVRTSPPFGGGSVG